LLNESESASYLGFAPTVTLSKACRTAIRQCTSETRPSSRSSSILRCVRALIRVCRQLLLAACRWIIMTSIQIFPVPIWGYRPCSLCSPLCREHLVHRAPAPRDGGRACLRRNHAPEGGVTCQSPCTAS